MARYWVGGNGNWTNVAHWSTSSGGGGGAAVPTLSDDVFVDANSGNPVITIPVVTNPEMKSLRFDFGTIQDVIGMNPQTFTVAEDAIVNGGNLNLSMCEASVGDNYRAGYALWLVSGSVNIVGWWLSVGSLRMSGGTLSGNGTPIYISNSLSSNEMAVLIDAGAFGGVYPNHTPLSLVAPSSSGRQIVRDNRPPPFKDLWLEVSRPASSDTCHLVGSLKIRSLVISGGYLYHGTTENPQQPGDVIDYEGAGSPSPGPARIWVWPWGGLDFHGFGSAGTTNIDLSGWDFINDGWFRSGGTVNYYNTGGALIGSICSGNGWGAGAWYDEGVTTMTVAGLLFVRSGLAGMGHGVSYWNNLTVLNGGGQVWFMRDQEMLSPPLYGHMVSTMHIFGRVGFLRNDNINLFEAGKTSTIHPGGVLEYGQLFDAFSLCYVRSARRDPATLAITVTDDYHFLVLMPGGTVTPIFTNVRSSNAGAGEIIWADYPATPNVNAGRNVNWWFGGTVVPVELWID